MIKILAIGDSHIPQRAKKIPDQIYTKLTQIASTDKFDFTFFTGDVIKAPNFINFLNNLTRRKVLCVIGNMDYYSSNQDAPIFQALTISLETNNNLIIGLTHGHRISPRGDHAQLESLAIQKNYKILISGHTHKEEVILTSKNILLLNPGSVTGAWSFIASRNPSFIVIQIEEKTSFISVTLYQYDIRASIFRDFNFYYHFNHKKIFTK